MGSLTHRDDDNLIFWCWKSTIANVTISSYWPQACEGEAETGSDRALEPSDKYMGNAWITRCRAVRAPEAWWACLASKFALALSNTLPTIPEVVPKDLCVFLRQLAIMGCRKEGARMSSEGNEELSPNRAWARLPPHPTSSGQQLVQANGGSSVQQPLVRIVACVGQNAV